MSRPRTPTYESRRRKDLRSELLERTRLWLPEWRPRQGAADFATAIVEIAARIEAEVTQRLDKVPEKSFRGFLHWLGVRGEPGRAARLPVVFAMAAGSEPVDADRLVQLQAAGPQEPITFETEQPLRILPAKLVSLVAADPANDRFYLPPDGLFSLEKTPTVPNEWTVKASAEPNATQLQLEPPLGLEPGVTLVTPDGQHYRVTAIEAGIVTIDPPLGTMASAPGVSAPAGAGLAGGARVTRLSSFSTFGDRTRNRQAHALYIGSENALNIEIPAIIEITGGAAIPSDSIWSYWGKPSADEPAEWRRFEETIADNGDLFLVKPAGAIETTNVDGHSSRWIRATLPAGRLSSPHHVSDLRLLINCPLEKGTDRWSPRIRALYDTHERASEKEKLKAEGIANTAPLVLDVPFYPLGREPRLFDSFYLGSEEVFSKKSARVSLHFIVDDGFSSPLAAVAFGPTDHLIVGVGSDRKLHRMWQSERADRAGGTRLVSFKEAVQPPSDSTRPISLTDKLRPGAAFFERAAHVTVAADNIVWRFTQGSADDKGRWEAMRGSQPNPIEPKNPTDTVLVVSGLTDTDVSDVDGVPARLLVYALGDGDLFRRDATVAGDWSRIKVQTTRMVDGNPETVDAKLSRIVPVVHPHLAAGNLDQRDGLLGVTTDGRLIGLEGLTIPVKWSDVVLDTTVYPLLIKETDRLMCVARRANGDLIALDSKVPTKERVAKEELVGHAFSFVAPRARGANRDVAIVLVSQRGGSHYPTLWSAFDDQSPLVGEARADLSEGPVAIGKYLLFPGENGDAHLTSVVLQGPSTSANLTDAAIFSAGPDLSAETSLIVDLTPTSDVKEIHAVKQVLSLPDGTRALELDAPITPSFGKLQIDLHRALHASRGAMFPKDESIDLELDVSDPNATPGTLKVNDLLYVKWGNHARIATIANPNGKTITLKEPLWPRARNVEYQAIERIAPLAVVILPCVDISGVADKATLQKAMLYFPNLDPSMQIPRHVLSDRLLLSAPWRAKPMSSTVFFVVGPFEPWDSFAAARPNNPELSWEYWDGTGWWQVTGIEDGTGNLVRSGHVTFCVPENLEATDVVGHSNHWIRARLIGGDYGQQSVTTNVIEDANNKVVGYTVERSIDKIHAPYVLTLDVAYEVCCPIPPDFILAEDNGAFRDQTTAGKVADAVVEYFVPLAHALGQLTTPSSDSGRREETRPSTPDCVDCATGKPAPSDGAATSDQSHTPVSSGRALYLGFDTELSGGPIRILFLVDREGDQDSAFPLQVEALVAGRFKPIVARDETRGLNESGVIELTLAESPQRTHLFGQTRYWLRLQPRADAEAWSPSIRGAYLNGVWATATETQSLEFLGSSDGSPDQHVALTRPPVLADSLVLRVREPLGDEDIAELNRTKADTVLEKPLSGRPGPWVLWKEVVDPADRGRNERVYAFDNAKGEITFGDGLHGMIPPADRDAIVAVEYKRGVGAAANEITARSEITLVTPLAGVESVVAVDGAAGGSDPQDDALTVAFAPANLNTRDRALSLHDFEVLTLQSSRDIAQARALSTRDGVRLIVVMRGRNPRPTKAQERELRRHLVERASPGAADTLDIIAPDPVPLHVDLRLQVDALEHVGSVAKEAVRQIQAMLDPAEGGHDRSGWRLGDLPSDTDIAAVLVGIAHLESIEDIRLTTVNADGQLEDLTRRLRPAELVQLVPDGVRIEFSAATLEVA